MKPFLLLLVLLFVTTSGCRTKGPRFEPARGRALDAAEQTGFSPVTLSNALDAALLERPTNFFRLGPGDVIEVEMLGEAGSRAAFVVGPDGKIYYSLLPGISVWGLSLSETKALLERELSRFARGQPELVVTLRAVGSQRVWMMGAVTRPNVYVLATPMTLLEALSSAGGTATFGLAGDVRADFRNSFVMRDGQFLPIDFERLLMNGDLSQNIYLQPDDFVFVRPTGAPSVYVLGAVAAPNAYPLTRDTSVASALVAAGGTLRYAQHGQVVIIRGGLSEPKIAEVNYKAITRGKATDVLLAPGDIVYVPYAPYRRLAELAEQALNQFVRTIAINEGRNLVDPRIGPVQTTVPGGGLAP